MNINTCHNVHIGKLYVIFQGGIGLNVAQMIVELIRDKRKIVDRMTREQIDEFVGLLQKSQVCTILKF